MESKEAGLTSMSLWLTVPGKEGIQARTCLDSVSPSSPAERLRFGA